MIPRGARVKFSADQTAQDFTAGATVNWNAEVFDTNTIHSNSVNPQRLTVPKGFTLARVDVSVYVTNMTAASAPNLLLRKNGTTIAGMPSHNEVTNWAGLVSSGLVPVSPGDYFDSFLQVTGDASIDILAARSFMSIELIP
jgi:hypothetical protein